MSEERAEKLKEMRPLNEEEFAELIQKVEASEDFDSELAKLLFSFLLLQNEYGILYDTLRAYYAAASGACHDVAASCAKTIGLRDTKKIMKMYKIAAEQAGNIPARAQALLAQDITEGEETENEQQPE
jgi:hypothetical protein